MIKKTGLLALTLLALSACDNDKTKEKTLLNEVIKCHDKVMNDDNQVMHNKMLLKSIEKGSSTPGVADSTAMYTKLLDHADDQMMAWMNKFNADFTGKSHQEIMDYLAGQKAQIGKIDTQLSIAIISSNKYILKVKGK